MKAWVIVVMLAACGPEDVPGTVDVTSATCTLVSNTMFTVHAEADVSIEVGQIVGMSADLEMPPGSANFTNGYTCGAWIEDTSSPGIYSYGCKREAGQPPDEHIGFDVSYTYQNALPASPRIELVPVLFSGVDLRNEEQSSTTITCN